MADQDHVITLRGSAKLVAEFFGHSVNSILYQRGIYDPDAFTSIKQYGVRMQVTTDAALKKYIENVMRQLEGWLENKQVQKLVLVVASTQENDAKERWVFDVGTNDGKTGSKAVPSKATKSEKDIRKEIGAIIRQITASVSFLPLLETTCWFDLLVYTPQDCTVPPTWEETDPMYIAQSSEVRLRSFNTTFHEVGTSVMYKVEDDIPDGHESGDVSMTKTIHASSGEARPEASGAGVGALSPVRRQMAA